VQHRPTSGEIWQTGLQFSDNSKSPQDAAIRYEPAAAVNFTSNKNETYTNNTVESRKGVAGVNRSNA